MDEDKSSRDLAHELGNVRQEKVALQYLLILAAEEIESLADWVSDPGMKEHALNAAARLRRSAEL